MSSYSVILCFFGLFLLANIALIIAMFVSIGKQGDERRKKIIEKASTNTFFVTVLYMAYCILENLVKIFVLRAPTEDMNPLIMLTVIALIYFIMLLYYKRKYGD